MSNDERDVLELEAENERLRRMLCACTCDDLTDLERFYEEHYDDCPLSKYVAAAEKGESNE